jgi:hypothetical protein
MAAIFGHLNFKLVKIKTVQIICAFLGGIFGWLYFMNMYILNAKYGFYVFDIYHIFLCGLVIFISIWGGIRGTIRFGVFQIIGIPVFLLGIYLLLA